MIDFARPKRKLDLNIGDDLYGVSIEHLQEYLVELGEEIKRVDADILKKSAELTAAEQIFKKP